MNDNKVSPDRAINSVNIGYISPIKHIPMIVLLLTSFVDNNIARGVPYFDLKLEQHSSRSP